MANLEDFLKNLDTQGIKTRLSDTIARSIAVGSVAMLMSAVGMFMFSHVLQTETEVHSIVAQTNELIRDRELLSLVCTEMSQDDAFRENIIKADEVALRISTNEVDRTYHRDRLQKFYAQRSVMQDRKMRCQAFDSEFQRVQK